ncbi:hypothetical protein L1987_33492 [Smallanthus sonchifolius]|uniref:Uncharacterized protein n=1 Tax=Smallanthus sonchifolius TaxID=185202 RepID=A0ACB9HSM1_9ASTR|nr:hypothetical protein L1987_33492 [Smallanthus sonchifolius]
MRTATVMVDPSLVFENPRFRTAYIALQAWNRPSIGSDLLDISNNMLSGKFPYVVLKLPELKFLDLRFNEFEGKVPRLSSGEYWEHVRYFE